MSVKLHYWLIAILTLCLGCQSSESGKEYPPPEKHLSGSFYYESDLDLGGRIRNVAGSHISGHVQLNYYAPPEGVHDGDHGTDLYLWLADSSYLKAGATYTARDSNFKLYVAEWASPAGYDTIPQDSMQGKVSLTSFDHHRELILDLYLEYSMYGRKRKFEKEIKLRKSRL